MSRIQLIAETPRAGQWNHCFIVAPTGDLSGEEVIREVLTAARHCPQGEDYLAVSVEAAQMLSGRTGREILVLTGIEVNRLSDTQRQQVMVQLERRLADLATLVTEKVDWEQEGKGGLVKRVELVDWEKDFSDLPPARKRRLSQSERKRRTNQLIWAGSVIGILLVGIAIWSLKNPESQSTEKETIVAGPTVAGPTSEGPPQPADNETIEVNTEKKEPPSADEIAKWWAEQQKFIREKAKEAVKWWAEQQKLIQEKAKAMEDAKQRKAAEEQKLQKFIEKLREKVSNVKCEYKTKFQETCTQNKTVSFICQDVIGYNYDNGELSGQITKWCRFPDSEKHWDDITHCFSNEKKITPVIDFFFQEFSTNKEILCPTNPTTAK